MKIGPIQLFRPIIFSALCAVAARAFAECEFKAYGDAESGFIIVPCQHGRGAS